MGADQIERIGNGWQTPDWFLDKVRTVFGGEIELDPCTFDDNPTEAARFYTTGDDGLVQYWEADNAFVNPPYGRGYMVPWADKIVASAESVIEIIALTRGDTSTAWARTLIRNCDAVCFPKRIKFKGASGSPNFANLIFYFGYHAENFETVFKDLGPVLTTEVDF